MSVSTEPIGISVVLPVHAGAKPGQLREALTSVLLQTRPADEIIIVEDGPLGSDLTAVLDEIGGSVPLVRRLRIAENRGVAVAVQLGVEAARYRWIARMDSDDIALPERLATQMDAISSGGYDLLGTAMSEFRSADGALLGVRRMPTEHVRIVRALRSHNAFNHPTVLFRRSLALRVGGYRSLDHLEDYDLFVRMWSAGARLHNLPEPLVKFRADDDMFRRRRAPGIHRAELQLQRNLRAYGLISAPRMIWNLAVRTSFRLLPPPIMRWAYRIIFRT